MAGRVRTHTRRTASGGTTTVRQHTRRTRGRRGGLVTPGHAWTLARRAFRSARRRKRLTALVLGGLALGEMSAWLTLRGAGLALATAGARALGRAWLAASASGMEL